MENKKPEITSTLLRPDEIEDLFSFMKLYQPTWEKFQEYWKWRQEGVPFSGGEIAAVAREKDVMIGCVGVVPARLYVNDEVIKASWQQDSLVAPAGRGKGIGNRLINKGGEGWDLLLAKGTSEAMYGLRKKLGFVDAPNADYLLRVEKPRLNTGKPKQTMLELALFLYDLLLPLPGVKKDIVIEKAETFDESFNKLASEILRSRGIRLLKDQGYLNWRYTKCPGRKYYIFRAGGNEARGAVVLGLSGSNAEEGWIVDLICSPEDIECAYALIKKGLSFFKENSVSRIYTFATLSSSRKWFKSFGFVSTGRSPRFTYRVQNSELESKQLGTMQWDFWHGDGDVELYM